MINKLDSNFLVYLEFLLFTRFRMQVMLDGRRFPPAEASNKKIAKKDAAAITLKILSREMEGGLGDAEEKPGIERAESTSDLADDLLVCLVL